MKTKKILMAVANYYTSPFQVGSHHYARAFAKAGYQVCFVSNPISPLHAFFGDREHYWEKKRIWEKGGEDSGPIRYYVPGALFTPQNKPLLSSNFVFHNWQKCSFPPLVEKLKSWGFGEVDIIWMDSPLFGFLQEQINCKHSILRIADYAKGFSAVSQVQFKAEMEIADRADLVLYTAANLKEKYPEIKDKTKMLHCPNGIDTEHFANADCSRPEELKNIPSPIILYIGAVHEWFDYQLLCKTAKALPECSFLIIGSKDLQNRLPEKTDNIFSLPPVPHNQISRFLSHANVGIIPFLRNPLVESIHPLKLYEYMFFGLPVVSTNWEELRQMSSPALLSDSHEEFIQNLKTALSEKDKTKYQTYAKSNTWQQRVESIFKALKHTN
jgi:glycosyltransferase involved in cell wall biosynthesis